MKSLKNRMLAMILTGVLLFSTVNTAYAQDSVDKLDKIIELGIIQGEGNGIDASQTLSRYRGISIQLKLIGLWDDMIEFDYKDKQTFNDAYKYSPFIQKLLSYLKNTPDAEIKGYPDGSFKPLNDMTVHEFVNIMLLSLGYKNGTDYDWNTVPEFAEKVGLISADETYDKPITINKAAEVIYDALLLEGTDEEGNFGEETGFVIEDTRGPKVSLTDFNETVESNSVLLKGYIDEPGELKINDKQINIDENLSFETRINLNVGKNIIKTETVDNLGHISVREFEIERISNELSVLAVKSDSIKMTEVEFNSQVDPLSVKKENFIIEGLNVGKVQLKDDNKTVMVMLADNEMFNQQEEHVFASIKDIKDINGNIMTEANNIKFYVSDINKPSVVSAEAERNNEIKITFSEPVKEEQASDISNYELNGSRFVGTIKGYDYNTVILHSVNLKNDNEIKISNIRDFNNLIMEEQSLQFNYSEDIDAPKIEAAEDVTLESVKLVFNEKIDFDSVDKNNIIWSYTLSPDAGKTATDVELINDKTILVHFKDDNSLTPTRLNIFVNGIKDISGNVIEKNSYIKVKASIDETKPEVKELVSSHEGNQSVSSNGSTKISVEFTKPVVDINNENGYIDNFEIKDNQGKTCSFNIVKKDINNNPSNKIELVVEDIPEGEYTLIVKGFEDVSKYPNTMKESEHTFTVENMKIPQAEAVYFEKTDITDNLYIQFSEPMNDTISDPEKYMIRKNGTWKKLKDEINGVILTKNDNLYAVIPLNSEFENYEELEISFVENSAGNTILNNKTVFDLKNENIIKNINTVAPEIKYAEITSKNQIKLYVNRELNDAYFKDFWITDIEKSIPMRVYQNKTANLSFENVNVKEKDILTDLNNNGNTDDNLNIAVVTINFVNDVFNSVGKFSDGKDVVITVNPDKILHTADLLGNKLINSTIVAVDKISPFALSDSGNIYFHSDNLKATIPFDEKIVIEPEYEAYAANDIVIMNNSNKVLVPGIDYSVSVNEGNLEITFKKQYNENLYINASESINFIKDLNGNAIDKFKGFVLTKKVS